MLDALRLSHKPAAAFAAMGLCWGAYSAQIPDIKAHIGASDALFGALVSAAAVGLITAMLIAPMIDARLGRRAMPLGIAFLGLAFLLPGIAPSPLAFGLAMFATAIASGVLDIVMNARVSELESIHKRTLMNANHGAFSLAYGISAFGTGLARTAQWPPIAIFAVALIFALALSTRTAMAPRPLEEGQTTAPLPLRVITLGGLIVLLAFMAEGATEVWSALHIERTLGGNAMEGAIGPTMLGLTMAAGRFGGQWATGVMRESTLLTLATLIATAGGVVAALAPSPAVAYLGFGVLGLGISVIGPTALAMVGRRVGDGPRTKAISRTAVIGFSGFFIGPPIMGVLSQTISLRASFLVLAALLALILIPLAMLKAQPKS